MRFIHASDIHLGSRLTGKLPEEKSAIRKRELRESFSRMVAYAKEQGISAILLSGDVFDVDSPSSKDAETFYSVVSANPDITFYYLRGNHDQNKSQSQDFDNLKRFGEAWTSYDLGDNAVLTGIEFTLDNASSLYSTLSLDPRKKNIVTLHGQLGSSAGIYLINLSKLKDKNIDYLALGHIHERQVGELGDGRGIWGYPGCLEGRGYDEVGPKGFYIVDTSLPLKKGGLSFVAFSKRFVEVLQVDISGCKTAYDIYQRIQKDFSWSKDNLLRVELVGDNENPDQELEKDLENYLQTSAFHVSVKDHSTPKIDIDAYLKAPTLRGEFVRRVMALSNKTDEEKKRIILTGLRALNGEGLR